MLSDDIHVPREYEGFLKAIYALGAELIYKVPYGGGALIKYKNLLIKIERDWNDYYLCLGFADKYEEKVFNVTRLRLWSQRYEGR